jgi:hypothetical protein
MDFSDTYEIFFSSASEYTFFSATPGPFSKIDNILGQKICIKRF